VRYGVTTKELTILFLVQATQENDSNAVFRGDEVVWRFPWGGGPPKNECQSRTTVRMVGKDDPTFWELEPFAGRPLPFWVCCVYKDYSPNRMKATTPPSRFPFFLLVVHNRMDYL
jgi:hypothetical protein